MDDDFVHAQKDHQGQEDSFQRVSKEQELSAEGTLNSCGSNLKRLVSWSNSQHAVIAHVKRSQVSKCCTKSSLFPSALGVDRRIPKHIVSLDEKFRRRCMELIHISASKAARCSAVVNLSSAKIGTLPESLNVAKVRSGDTYSSTRFVFECPLAAGDGSVVISPAGKWVVGTIMGSKSMMNILKSPLFHQFGPLSNHTDLRKINSNDVKGSICYDFSEPLGGSNFSSSPVQEKETPIKGNHKNGSDTGHKRFVSICSTSTNSLCSDQSSPALTTVSQGMLQCTWKGGNPHFVFSTDETREVYVANLWKVESEEDKTLDYVYLFHSGKGGQKGHEIRDSESHLVGKMKVNNVVSLCSNNSKITETEFVLFGGGIEMHTSGHNLRKNKGLSKKVVEVFRTSHPSKQRTISKSGPCSILENSPRESFLDTGNSEESLGAPNLLEDHLPPNFELAAIVVKDHIPDDRKEEAGGWGLKFLKKVGVKKIINSVEASVPIEWCRNNGDCSTSMHVLIPAGLHGGPRTRNGGPSSLTERWRTGGQCDCGGWDLGCPLTVLQTKSNKDDISPQSDTQGECKSFDLNRKGSEHAPPALRMLNVHDGLYFVHFQPTLSVLQSFSIAVAIIHSQSPTLRLKCTRVLSTKIQG